MKSHSKYNKKLIEDLRKEAENFSDSNILNGYLKGQGSTVLQQCDKYTLKLQKNLAELSQKYPPDQPSVSFHA